ncbi:MAG: helix-turn-helix transcriptional regulator [Treponema sp.]|nr:helix-turn-helix transcriptional regulator [Treponema sp.]
MSGQEEPIQKIFGANVQKYRKKANLTQTELSERLEISQKHLSVIETGNQFASANLIEKISNELNVPPASLFGGEFGIREVNMIQLLVVQQIDAKLETLYSRIHEDLLKMQAGEKLNN